MGLFTNFMNEFEKLDHLEDSNGEVTEKDIMNLNLSSWFKKFIIFILKRTGDVDYHYLVNNTKYEYYYDIPKEIRHQAETIFTRKEKL